MILKGVGEELTESMRKRIEGNERFMNIKAPSKVVTLEERMCKVNKRALDLLKKCLVIDPEDRYDCS